MIAGSEFDLLHPLGRGALVLPFRHLKPKRFAHRLHAVDDALEERVGAVVGDRHHLLASGTFLGIEGRARGGKDRLGEERRQILLGSGDTIGGGVGKSGR